MPYHELTDAQNRTKRRRRLSAKEYLEKKAGTKDEALVKAFTEEALGKKKSRGRTKATAGAAAARDKDGDAKLVIECQTELCGDLGAYNKEPHPLLLQHVEEIRAEVAKKQGIPSDQVKWKAVARRVMSTLTPTERSQVSEYKEGRRNAKALRRALIATFVNALGTPKRASDLGLPFCSNLFQAVKAEVAASKEPDGGGLAAVVLEEYRNKGGRTSWEEKRPGIEAELKHKWQEHCRPAAGKKGRKGLLVIQGLKGDVALEILKEWNASHDEPITRYLVEKCCPRNARLATSRGDLCPICIGGAHTRRLLGRMVENLKQEHPAEDPAQSAKQWAENPRVDWCKRWNLKKALRSIEEVDLHQEDVRQFLEHKDAIIDEAYRPAAPMKPKQTPCFSGSPRRAPPAA